MFDIAPIEKSDNSGILYRSSACIVINKLKGEAVEGAAKGMINLSEKLALLLPDAELIEAVHRLDVPVTGCALFALSNPALVFLNSAFAGKDSLTVEKHYWAIVEKPVFDLPQEGELVHWIETNNKTNKSFAYNEESPASSASCNEVSRALAAKRKKASLHYKVLNTGQNYLCLEIRLLTGRHHQIRAQLEAIGLFIKGDLKYGAKRSEKTGGIRLHARSLLFPDPLNHSVNINVSSDPPEMDNLWRLFYQ